MDLSVKASNRAELDKAPGLGVYASLYLFSGLEQLISHYDTTAAPRFAFKLCRQAFHQLYTARYRHVVEKQDNRIPKSESLNRERQVRSQSGIRGHRHGATGICHVGL